jgi:hypothetical protein
MLAWFDPVPHLLNLDNKRYPDDIFINIIFETNDEELAIQIANSFDRSLIFINKKKV